MLKAYVRTRQFIFSRVTRLFEKKSPKIISHIDSLLDITNILKENKVTSAFVCTTSGFLKRKTLEPFFETLDKENIKYCTFTTTADPEIACIEEGVKVYQENACQAIVAIGGGSVIDCSKIIGARIVKPHQTVPQMKGLLKVLKKLPLFIAVPTSAGTGSEVTCAAVVTDQRNGTHYKYPISDYSLIPSYAILDPKLLVSLPAFMSATTGMDALTHAVEAYTNLFASSYVKAKALEAIKLIFENLLTTVKEPENLEAREKMLLASNYAGTAFTNNFVGYVHALAHGLGGIYGISHGLANSILLVPCLKQYGESVYKTLAEVADYCGISGKDEKDKALKVIETIDKLREDCGITNKCEQLLEKDFNELCDRAIMEGIPSYPCPQIWTRDDFKTVLKNIM